LNTAAVAAKFGEGPNMKSIGLALILTVLICAASNASAQEVLTNRCQVKTGTVYSKTFEDLASKESAAIAKVCAYNAEPGWTFGAIAGVKASSAIRTHDSNYESICNAAGTDPAKLSYCGYIYRSQWQATCCERSL
jgi:hypothetical protein